MARDVAIVGGGIIGLTCAYLLARRGTVVTVYDAGDFGKQASWAGAGIIPPGNPRWAATPIDWLRAYSSSNFDTFTSELRNITGIDNGYRKCGAVEFLGPEDEGVIDLWKAERIRFEPYEAHLEPNLRIGSVEPVFLPDCGQVRNPWHIRALVLACAAEGVELRRFTSVTGYIGSEPKIEKLRLSDGTTVDVGRVLFCPGAWAKGLLSHLGCDLEVRPVRGQIALLQSEIGTLNRVVMVGKRYLVPRGDGLILIGSSEEPEAGFTLGTTPEVVMALRAFAIGLVPKLADVELVKAWSGLRPGTPDGLPYLGRAPGWENVFAAAGHFRAGVQLSLGTAEVMTRLLLEGIEPDRSFALDREPSAAQRPAFRS